MFSFDWCLYCNPLHGQPASKDAAQIITPGGGTEIASHNGKFSLENIVESCSDGDVDYGPKDARSDMPASQRSEQFQDEHYAKISKAENRLSRAKQRLSRLRIERDAAVTEGLVARRELRVERVAVSELRVQLGEELRFGMGLRAEADELGRRLRIERDGLMGELNRVKEELDSEKRESARLRARVELLEGQLRTVWGVVGASPAGSGQCVAGAVSNMLRGIQDALTENRGPMEDLDVTESSVQTKLSLVTGQSESARQQIQTKQHKKVVLSPPRPPMPRGRRKASPSGAVDSIEKMSRREKPNGYKDAIYQTGRNSVKEIGENSVRARNFRRDEPVTSQVE